MPLFTLATDFGESSPYVAMLKGRLLSLCPEARLVDLTHSLPADDVFGAALFLLRVCFHYPAGTVHLVGLDRGDGPDRALIAQARSQRFLAMDNGVLGLVLNRAPDAAVRLVALAERTTFTARDTLAPLACGPATAGELCTDWRRLTLPTSPQILHVDGFGNLITNLRPDPARRIAAVVLAGREVRVQNAHYGLAPPGRLFAYWGAEGWLEIALPGGSAARRLGVGRGTPVEVR